MDFVYLIIAIVVFTLFSSVADSAKKNKQKKPSQPSKTLGLPMSDIEQWYHDTANQGQIPPEQRHPEPTPERPVWTHEGESSIGTASFAPQGLSDAAMAAVDEPAERNPLLPADADDWRKAIIFSEILKPKF